MSERMEYWWVQHGSQVQPAEVGFVGGIPVRFRFIGVAGTFQAETTELIERLPNPPASIFRPQVTASASASASQKSGSLLWLIGILLLIFVAQCSGPIFDAIK